MSAFKRILYVIILGICLVSCLDSADPEYIDPDYDDQYEEVDTSTTTTRETMVVPTAPPVTEERKKIEEDAASLSPFLEEGCCSELEKRVDKCCCDAVLEKYKVLKANGDKKLGEYKMKDPILGKCRSKLPKAFDEIDNPPIENPEDDW